MSRLISYAMDFVSFLIEKMKDSSEIKSIILFGSVARQDTDKNSDVDIFIDTKKDIQKEVGAIKESFLESIKYKKYWKLLGVENNLDIQVGEIKKWDLERSIISNGIVLYGKYFDRPKTKGSSLFVIKAKGERKNQIKLWRKLYGYKQKVNDKIYKSVGLLSNYGGKKLGNGVFLVPIEHTQHVIAFLRKEKTNFEVIDVWIG
ncbi:MAG: nucleotidyltransferase domain-containing protein [archaeon]